MRSLLWSAPNVDSQNIFLNIFFVHHNSPAARRSMDPIFAIQTKDRECIVSRMDAVAVKRSASMLRKTMIVLAKVGAALLCTLEQGLVSR
jgi:hypothetical protein